MNSLTRPLPLRCQWRRLSVPTAVCENKLTLKTADDRLTLNHASTSTHPLLLNPDSRSDVMATVEACRCYGAVLIRSQQFHTAARLLVEHQLKIGTGLQNCYSLLEVEEDCSDKDLKAAYLEKAKAYHPDSASPTTDAHKFSQVKEAYKTVLEHRKGRELLEEEEQEAEIIFDIKHTAPQHRQYLEFEGVGFGTPSQRQRQYQQHRVERVTENIFQHRIQRLAAETEDALVVKDKQQARKVLISNAMHRMVEDMIQESMKRGDFKDLPGQGQPLAYSAHNPFVDVTTHNLNKIMVNNGLAPEWIMLQSEIRKELQQARQTLAMIHKRLGEEPHSEQDAKRWRAVLSKFQHHINEVNSKVSKFNLIVPFLNKQLVHYNADREVKKVLDNLQEYLPEDEDTACLAWDISLSEMPSSLPQQNIDWRQVWQDIKTVFQSSRNKEVKV